MTRLAIEGFRLSPQQRRVWSLQQAGGSLDYRAHCTSLIEGRINVELFESALRLVVDSNDILRATLHTLPEMILPLQSFTTEREVEYSYDDLAGLSADKQEPPVEEKVRALAVTPFDFERGPLLRVSLLKLAADRYVLAAGLPALIGDRGALYNLLREICRAYSSLAQGRNPAGAGLQYSVISEWQNELLDAEETRAGRAYWRRVCDGAVFNPALPLEKRLIEKGAYEPRLFRLPTGGGLLRNVNSASAHYDASAPDILLSCWAVLLSRMTASPDITIGVTFDGRTDEELEESLGLLAKSLPVRCRMGEETTFGQLLRAVEEATGEAREWQECFAWELVEGANSEGQRQDRLSFGFEYYQEPPPFDGSDFSLTIREQYACIEPYKIKLVCGRAADALLLELNFDSRLVSEQEVSLIARRYEKILESVSEHPQTPLARLDIVSPSERQQILEEFNQTERMFETDVHLHNLFERQAEQSPGQVAVVFESERVTFEELNKRANQLAHYLRRRGVRSDEPVGLCLERSVDMVVGMLGILKAGGAYVPLDPTYPQQRLEAMQQGVSAKVMVCHDRTAGKLGRGAAQVVSLDGDRTEIEKESTLDLPDVARPLGLAYLIYTSGSTGVPKAVMITHRAIVNHMKWMQEEFPLDSSDRVLQKTPFSFDASVWEFFAPLLSGAELVMARPGGHLDSRYLVEAVKEERITVLQLVPTMLRAMLEEDGIRECKSLRRVYSGGEALSVELQKRCEEAMEASLYNLYGPTEATIDSAFWMCEKNSQSETVPIGRPIANTCAYILDRRLQEVPIGMIGELFVSGEGLARGYFNNPALTAERFIPDPYSKKGGERLYRTGDQARYRLDGAIDYLGRGDHQVKIRGYRVELGEIESVLEQHDAIKEAAVLVRDDKSGERAIVAYLVLRQDETITTGEVQEFLRTKLPDYMVPSRCVVVERFPVMPNGKTDRNALLAIEPESIRTEADDAYTLSQVEEMLAAIWQQVLKVETVGRDENFFELGGHSLLATQVVSSIREFFQVELLLEMLFNNPKLKDLAQRIEEQLSAGNRLQATPITRVPRTAALPLSFAQQRLWFIHQLYPDSPAYNLPIAVRIQGDLNLAALEKSLGEIVRRHEVLRTTFKTINEATVQVIAPNQPVVITRHDLRERAEPDRENEAQQIVAEEARKPFDLATGPLLRATVVLMGEEDHIVVLTLHHIVFDNWSSGILVKELGALYEAFSKGEPSPLTELPIQYADFAVWQREWLQGEALQAQLDYWKKKLAGQLPVIKLPADRINPSASTFNGRERAVLLTEDLSRSLKQLSNQEGVTLFMTLLAAFKTLLYRYTGQDDVVLGSPIANRTRSETEGLIGFFVNNLVLRTDLAGNPSFRELLGRIRKVTLEAFAHQDLPFEKIIEELQPERDLSHTPLFRIMFAYQNAPTSALNLSKIKLSAYKADKGTTVLDLLLAVTESKHGLIAHLSYNSDLFEDETIEFMLAQYRMILEQAAAQPEVRLLNIPVSRGVDQEVNDADSEVADKYLLEQFNF